MLEVQEIEIMDRNQEYCIYFPDTEKRSRLDEINMRVSPLTAAISTVLLYDAFANDSSNSMIIGGTIAATAAFGIKDLVVNINNRRKNHENVVFDSLQAELEVFTLV